MEGPSYCNYYLLFSITVKLFPECAFKSLAIDVSSVIVNFPSGRKLLLRN